MLRNAVKKVVPAGVRRRGRSGLAAVSAFLAHPHKTELLKDKAYDLSFKYPSALSRTTQRLLFRKWARSPSLFRTRDSDVFLLSFPKCGRTWLRVMLSRYLLQLDGKEQGDLVDIYTISKQAGLPVVTIDHEDCYFSIRDAHYKNLETNKTRYRDRKVAFLVRDPRDTMVSYHIYCTKRTGAFTGTMGEFLRHPRFGIDMYLRYLQIWEANRHVPKEFILLRYEDMKQRIADEFTRLLAFCGFPIRPDLVRATVEFGSFSNMQKMEAKKEFTNNILRPGDANDTETFKVRKGKVGDYASYMTPEDIAFVEAKMRAGLPDFYGYALSAPPLRRAA